jgi:hypothetical protein
MTLSSWLILLYNEEWNPGALSVGPDPLCWLPLTPNPPTASRYTYLLDKLVTHGMHTLFVGPTGTGKTVYIKRHLQQGLPPATWTSMFMTFSAQTSANMTQVGVWHMHMVLIF